MSEPQKDPSLASQLGRLMDMPMTARLVLGKAEMEIGKILHLGQGSVIRLESTERSPLELFVEDRKVASAEVVTRENGLLAARIIEINSVESRFMGLARKEG